MFASKLCCVQIVKFVTPMFLSVLFTVYRKYDLRSYVEIKLCIINCFRCSDLPNRPVLQCSESKPSYSNCRTFCKGPLRQAGWTQSADYSLQIPAVNIHGCHARLGRSQCPYV